MKQTPEDLEKFIHQALRDLPPRRAPRSLEQRVFAAIAARAALPWWKQSFGRWPFAARAVFLVLSTTAAAAVVLACVFGPSSLSLLVSDLQPTLAPLVTIRSLLLGLIDSCGAIFRAIPPLWIYGGLAFIGAMYLALFTLGAAAYRTLFAAR